MKRTLLLTTALVAFAGIAGAQTVTTPSVGGATVLPPSVGGATVTTPPATAPSTTTPSVPSRTTGAGGATVTTPSVGSGSTSGPSVGGTSTTTPGVNPPGVSTPGVNQATLPNDTSPAAQSARRKIEADGYKNVQGLAKGADGMWHGKAMRGGTEVQIKVDAKGNVMAQ